MKRVLSLCICFALVAAPALYAMAEDSALVITQTIVSEPVSVSVLAPVESSKTLGSTVGFADEVLRLVNAERAKQGLKPLSGGYVALNEAAAIRAQEQATLFGHTRPNKKSWSTVLDDKNVSRYGAAENVAVGQTSPSEVMNSWMNSKDGHRESILTPSFNYVGIGCYYSSKTNTYYWAQLFTTTYPTLSSENFFMDLGGIETFAVTSSPTNNRFTIMYDSSDPTVATIAGDGTVRALRTGTTELTAKYTDPSTANSTFVRGTTTATLTVVVPATRVSITQDSLKISKGSEQRLLTKIEPEGANPTIIWSSDRHDVATVDSQGTVTAVGVGNAVLTARAKSGVSATCEVKVFQNATKVTVLPLELTLEKGASQQMNIEILPLDHTEDGEIAWSSSAPGVVSVDARGTVTARGPGEAFITAMVPSGKTGTAKVKVIQNATSVTVTPMELTLEKGTGQQMSTQVLPLDHTEGDSVEWSSSNSKVASVDARGMLTARAVGDAVISAKVPSGKTGTARVTVVQNATKVTVVPLALTLEKGASQQMSTQVLPLDHTEGDSVEWSSSDPEVAFVDEKGMLTTRAAGVAVITARVPSGKTGTAQVKVAVATTGLALEESPERMKKAQTYRLNTKLQPADATGAIAFTSNNTKVAKVAADGTVTAIAPGNATIVAKADNGISASRAVTVWCEPTSITLGGAQTVNKGKTLRLTPTMKPANNEAVLIWSTRMPEGIAGDPDAVATVTQGGVLTAVGSGSIIVRVEALEATNGVYAEKLIIVKAPATEVSLDENALALHVGDEEILVAEVKPNDCTDQVTWSSSNKKVAKVDASGNVTAVGLGQAVITCKAQSGKSATCKVTVYADADGIVITNKSDILTVGKATSISYKLTPAGAYTPVTFKSSNPDVTVTAAGKVTASSAARDTSVTITVTTKNEVSATKTFQIKSPATAVTLSDTTGNTITALALHVNEGAGLRASLAPAGCTDSYTWSSSNKRVVTVDAGGNVKAIGIGNAKITCKAQSGKSATCKVTVYADAENITITTRPTTLNVGMSLKLAYTLAPLKANTPVTFTSSNAKIATVNPTTGMVRAVSAEAGTSVTITATTRNGETARYVLQIKAPATKLTLESKTLKIEKGEFYTLKSPTLTPTGCTDSWAWTSSNEKVATVNTAGRITAVGRGTATITCKAKSGKSAACKVTVWEEPKTVQISAAKKRINVKTSLKLATKQNPSNAAAPLIWTVSDLDIATVSEAGVVTCLAPGSFTVTAKTPGGAQSSVSLVSVQPATWVGAQQSRVSLPVGETYTLTYRLLPANSNDSVTFVSSNTSVATVSTGGVITARKAGTAKITIKTGSGKSVTCTVTVVKP